ncbi:hypothetical protein OY671_010514, partial [Metschnikowia pulcherrima]
AKLSPGETVSVNAGGSGIGTVAIMMAKAIGCTIITTVGDDSKIEGVKALGADHVINYRKDRFEHETRKITKKKGVDVVFEHVGADTFNGSSSVLKRGGRSVTWQRRRSPLVAASGGMAVPAAFYSSVSGGHPDSRAGWAIPAATDIAVAIGVMASSGSRVPTSLKSFSTTSAIVD